jgi:heme oxygenase
LASGQSKEISVSAAYVSAMAALRLACWPVHQRLEKRLDIKTRFGSIAPYRAHLAQMWGFCAGLERGALPPAFEQVLTDYPVRRKLYLLTQDLTVLGLDTNCITGLDRCELGACADVAAAFGSVYVLEGATLGGQTLLPLVAREIGVTAGHGASFLASYGADVVPMWQRFGAAVDAWCCDPGRRASATQAALRTFETLEAWLCGTRA